MDLSSLFWYKCTLNSHFARSAKVNFLILQNKLFATSKIHISLNLATTYITLLHEDYKLCILHGKKSNNK